MASAVAAAINYCPPKQAGKAMQGQVKQGNAKQSKARRLARHGKAKQARLGKARQGKDWVMLKTLECFAMDAPQR